MKKPLDPIEEKNKALKQKFRESPLFFAENILRDPLNPDKKFKAIWFQKELLTNLDNRLNTIRAKRSSGKSVCIVALLLWFAVTKAHRSLIVIGPYLRTVERIFKELNKQIDCSPELQDACVRRRNNPFEIYFKNGSIIEGQSTGVSSKAGGQAIRGWHGQFLYIDEADYLEDEDWQAFMPLITGKPGEEKPLVYATTTPTGKRSYFYGLCEDKEGQGKHWKDWWYAARHIPEITFTGKEYTTDENGWYYPGPSCKILCSGVDPFLDPLDDEIQLNASTDQQGYYHEQIAWWGDSAYSVFPKELLKISMDKAIHSKFSYIQNREQGRGGFYTIGMDVDKKQATPNICMIEYIPGTEKDGSNGTYVVRFREEMTRSAYVYVEARRELQRLNGQFLPRYIYIDKSPGDVTVEEMNAAGMMNVFGKHFKESANLVNAATNEMEAKPLKHVMINIAQRLFEQGRIVLSPVTVSTDEVISVNGREVKKRGPKWDDEFIKQLMNYQVVNVSKTGVPEYTSKDEHSVDAFLLAMWAAFENFDNPFGYTITKEFIQRDTEDTNLFGTKDLTKHRVGSNRRSREETTEYQTLEQYKSQYVRNKPGAWKRDFAGFDRKTF